jgi:hypothetical protein
MCYELDKIVDSCIERATSNSIFMAVPTSMNIKWDRTSIYISKEAIQDIQNWSVDSISEDYKKEVKQ